MVLSKRYVNELDDTNVSELAIYRSLCRVNYSRRCAEASAVKAYPKRGSPLAPGMEIGYVGMSTQALFAFDRPTLRNRYLLILTNLNNSILGS
jgi:hypothetical protein